MRSLKIVGYEPPPILSSLEQWESCKSCQNQLFQNLKWTKSFQQSEEHLFSNNNWILVRTVSLVKFYFVLFSYSFLQFHSSLKNQQPPIIGKPSSLALTSRAEQGWSSFQALSADDRHDWTCLVAPWRTSHARLSLFNLTQSLHNAKCLFPGKRLSKTIEEIVNFAATWGGG